MTNYRALGGGALALGGLALVFGSCNYVTDRAEAHAGREPSMTEIRETQDGFYGRLLAGAALGSAGMYLLTKRRIGT